MSDPLVSILIPAFNVQEYIGDTLASAVGQTWPRKEIVVVDDGSTDRTLTIANRFASNSVKVIAQKHQGAAATRNDALSLSHGDYIQWLDADDLLCADKIEQQMSALRGLRGKRALLSSAWARFMYRRSTARFVPTALWHDLSALEWLLRKMQHNVYMPTSTWLVSRESTEAAGPWNTRLLSDDDGEYFCRVLLKSDGVTFVPEAKVLHRMRGVDRLSYVGGSHVKMEALFSSMLLHISYLQSTEDSERVRATCVRYLQNGLSSFYPDRLDIVDRAEHVAADLGGKLEVPRLSWKYGWIETMFGRDLAKRAQVFLPNVRWSLVRHWDKLAASIAKDS